MAKSALPAPTVMMTVFDGSAEPVIGSVTVAVFDNMVVGVAPDASVAIKVKVSVPLAGKLPPLKVTVCPEIVTVKPAG